MQLANGSSVAVGAARCCRRTGVEVGVVGEMVFRIVKVVVLDFRVETVDDDNDDEAEAIRAVNPRGIKYDENIMIMRMSECISSPVSELFFFFHKVGEG